MTRLTGDSFPKIIVRHDIRKRWYDDNGIINIVIIDFLLDDNIIQHSFIENFIDFSNKFSVEITSDAQHPPSFR